MGARGLRRSFELVAVGCVECLLTRSGDQVLSGSWAFRFVVAHERSGAPCLFATDLLSVQLGGRV